MKTSVAREKALKNSAASSNRSSSRKYQHTGNIRICVQIEMYQLLRIRTESRFTYS